MIAFEDAHQRDTFWLEKKLKDRLHDMAADSKGAKTQIINDALREYFAKLDKEWNRRK